MKPTFRFAPSPNGELHLGHALSALVGYEMAQRIDGRFLLRIEDIDTGRSREDYVTGICRDLDWLGIRWEEPILRQSRQFADYRSAADRLSEMGLLYPCFASRTEIAATAARLHPSACDPEGVPLYPKLHKALSADDVTARRQRGEPFALRLDMERALTNMRRRLGNEPLTFREIDTEGNISVVVAHPERWGDCVIVRKDVPTSYHLAVTFDDARQGVTHVTRGRDIYAATDVQRLLQVLLDWPEPIYHHHRLIADPSGRKLSKSAGDTSLACLRTAGCSPADIRRLIGWVS